MPMAMQTTQGIVLAHAVALHVNLDKIPERERETFAAWVAFVNRYW